MQLKERIETAIIMITHNLGVIAQVAQRVVVMYVGLKVEEAPVRELFDQPMHPYTRGLMASIPRIDSAAPEVRRLRLEEIPGVVPSLRREIIGCPFAPRCRVADDECHRVQPPFDERTPGHWVACWENDRTGSMTHG